jgi:hypothetical protein
LPVTLGQAALDGFAADAESRLRGQIGGFVEALLPGGRAALGDAVHAGRVETAIVLGRAQGLSGARALGWFAVLLIRFSPHLARTAPVKAALALPEPDRSEVLEALFELGRVEEFGQLPPSPGPADDWSALRPGPG